MKKKIIFIVFMVIMLVAELFMLTGCGEKKEEEKKEEASQTVDETLVKIKDKEFHLKKEASFKDLKYTIAEEFKEADHGHYIQYNYSLEDNTNLLFYRVFYYEGKDNATAIKDLGLDEGIALTDGKNDSVEYKFYENPRNDGGTMHFYFINRDGNTYVVNFVSKYDIKDFENKVVKTIKF